jgi:hypothetical protein
MPRLKTPSRQGEDEAPAPAPEAAAFAGTITKVLVATVRNSKEFSQPVTVKKVYALGADEERKLLFMCLGNTKRFFKYLSCHQLPTIGNLFGVAYCGDAVFDFVKADMDKAPKDLAEVLPRFTWASNKSTFPP